MEPNGNEINLPLLLLRRYVNFFYVLLKLGKKPQLRKNTNHFKTGSDKAWVYIIYAVMPIS